MNIRCRFLGTHDFRFKNGEEFYPIDWDKIEDGPVRLEAVTVYCSRCQKAAKGIVFKMDYLDLDDY